MTKKKKAKRLKARIYKRKDGKREVQVKHRNGQVMFTSHAQGYNRTTDAVNALDTFIEAAKNDDIEIVVET